MCCIQLKFDIWLRNIITGPLVSTIICWREYFFPCCTAFYFLLSSIWPVLVKLESWQRSIFVGCNGEFQSIDNIQVIWKPKPTCNCTCPCSEQKRTIILLRQTENIKDEGRFCCVNLQNKSKMPPRKTWVKLPGNLFYSWWWAVFLAIN